MQFPTFVYFGCIIFLFTYKPTRAWWLISSQKKSSRVPTLSVSATIEIAPINAHSVQPVQLPEIASLHDCLPWNSTNFIFAASLWNNRLLNISVLCPFTDKETETQRLGGQNQLAQGWDVAQTLVIYHIHCYLISLDQNVWISWHLLR